MNGAASDLIAEIGGRSPELALEIQRLEAAGQKTGKGSDRDGTARYIAYHIAPEVFGTYVDSHAGNVSAIKFGGPSEKEFTALQRAIASYVAPSDQSDLSRTHSFPRQFGPAGPQQIQIVGKNHATASYYDDPKAHDVQISDSGKLRSNTGKPDHDTRMVEQITGGRHPLIAFMGDLMLPEYK